MDNPQYGAPLPPHRSSLGPSLARRHQAFPTDASGPSAVGSINHASTVHHHGLEYQSDARMHGSSTGTHSRQPVQQGSMPPHTSVPSDQQEFFASTGISPAAFDPELYQAMFGVPFGTAILIGEEAFRLVGASPQSTTGSQYGAPLPPHPLTRPDTYSQQPNTAGPVGVAPTFNHPNPKAADPWKFYFENFKGNNPLLRACDTEFKEKVGSLRTVQASLAQREDDGDWICPFDGETFTRKQNLEHHIQSHLGMKDPECNRGSASEARLAKREDVGYWTCPIDGETFTRKQNLKHHIQSHLGMKDFECNCGLTFNTLSGLKRHKKKCRSAVSSTSPTN